MAGRKASVLAVDDELNARSVLFRGLQQKGYDCITAADTDEASKLLRGRSFDVLLLDLLMPGKSAIEFLGEVVSEYPHLAVVVVSAVADTTTAIDAMREGADDYITKPVSFDDLVMRISRALDRRTRLLQTIQRGAETILDERMGHLRQRIQEVTILNSLLKSHFERSVAVEEDYARLQEALSDFATRLGELALQAQVIGPTNASAVSELRQALAEEDLKWRSDF